MRIRHGQPIHGETRIRSGFLLLPKRIGRETRWLEFARWEQTYMFEAPALFWLGASHWQDTRWLGGAA